MTDPTPEELRAAFLPRLNEELDALRSASAKTTAERRPVELDQQSVGRLSRMDAMQQQAMASAQDARRLGRVRALEAAIRRIDAEEFGWCDDCGAFIGMGRLDLEPTVMRCRDCAG
ncbi:TraR/DksA family transcriptional regulator [Jannaschia formosa]|uniref:TraR/DksA family transcriptional regulator n=1 Tax=Jannaschia formosa TaxID=2259592 RepID=UPI000E1B5B72|nr:TraR/DksA C4-type zinc finger protein [Jannaschia formosa]TFL16255.1 TraR/DksA family transcriptional regulator [Jannaschia formosa]